jgi:hypothetical protein
MGAAAKVAMIVLVLVPLETALTEIALTPASGLVGKSFSTQNEITCTTQSKTTSGLAGELRFLSCGDVLLSLPKLLGFATEAKNSNPMACQGSSPSGICSYVNCTGLKSRSTAITFKYQDCCAPPNPNFHEGSLYASCTATSCASITGTASTYAGSKIGPGDSINCKFNMSLEASPTPSPGPAPPTPSPGPVPVPGPGGEWLPYSGLNCYTGHGGTDLETPQGGSCGKLSLDACQSKCANTSGCTAIDHHTATSDCYRRKEIVRSQCDSCQPPRGNSTYACGFDLYVLSKS